MYLKYHLLDLLMALIVLEIRKATGIMNFCYNSTLEGFRLHTKVLKTIAVSQRIDCIIECVIEPCCRSINYKTTSSTSQNEKNCEMLHNVVYNTSKNVLEKTPSFDYVYLVNPEKEYNTSCFPKVKITAPGNGSGLTSCNVTKLIKKGCYRDHYWQRTLPHHIATYPKGVDWNEGWDDFVHNVTCFCAKLAKDGGHRFFGVQNFRECWAGELTPTFFVSNPKAGECWGVRPNYEECIDNTTTKCVGRPYYNYIYEIITEPPNSTTVTSG